jgi:hypothetical protein
MSVYYVTHPSIDLTAIVTAPTTEKARTTFLDYLERRGMLSRAKRGFVRGNMVAERLHDPASVTADVELSYGYEPMPEESLALEPSYVPGGVGSEFSGGEPIELTGGEEAQLPMLEQPPRPKRSPIAEAATRGFVK